ncbi:IclR family transcriptional regulator [Clostridium formicaceticum]|uniref:Glycerol operon regulatory protein n=1 Tax=Clostridium formicaceticum TaxID=1497 RepID=A0AAC9WES4_9CLOT|nr:IclR family transcriptional regulator [Clostridium formicaceticum]AOY75623.1 IclR family transcriptional regulator [Clostridium formicaceticum]ARE85934.1 Transcriptional regulator KdgR [Clostridium formicaceticum]
MSSDNHRSTSRVLDILEVLASSQKGYTLTEVAAAIDAPKSSIFPIIHTLQSRGYIEINENTSRYFLGIKALDLGSSYLNSHSMLSFIRKEMQHIVDTCSETCQLGILDKGDVLYIEKIDSPEPIRMISHVGKRLPAYCTSLGKALLCDHDKEALHNLFPEGLKKFTPSTITDIEVLYEQLLEVRQTQIAYESEEITEYIQCFAVPLRKNGLISGALSVTVPKFRLTEEKAELIKKQLLESQAKIEALMIKFNFDIKSIY